MSRSIESMLGLLKIRVKRGIDLVVSDTFSSDPYVVVTQGKQACFFHLYVTNIIQFDLQDLAQVKNILNSKFVG